MQEVEYSNNTVKKIKNYEQIRKQRDITRKYL